MDCQFDGWEEDFGEIKLRLQKILFQIGNFSQSNTDYKIDANSKEFLILA